MPLDGSGNYTPPAPQFPAVPGQVIYADYFNTIILDMAEALSKALYNDGQQLWLSNQNANNTSILNGRATTQPPGDNSTLIATTAFVTALAFLAAVPAQAGNAGKYVYTDGTTASWQMPVGQNLFNFYNLGGF